MQLEVYIENPVNKLCQLSKKGVHVIVSNLLWSRGKHILIVLTSCPTCSIVHFVLPTGDIGRTLKIMQCPSLHVVISIRVYR